MEKIYILLTKVKRKLNSNLPFSCRSYKSMIGAVVSALLLSTLFAYFVYKLLVLKNKSDTKLAKKSFFLDLDSDNALDYEIGKSGFDFSFGLDGPMNASIGYL